MGSDMYWTALRMVMVRSAQVDPMGSDMYRTALQVVLVRSA